MTTKPRYWSVAYPLLITSLCVAPHQFFLKNWSTAFEIGLVKLKVRRRTIVFLTVLTVLSLGETFSCPSHEWNGALVLDIPVSMPGVDVNNDDEIRITTQTLLPS